jgi:hypothetical protein
MLTVTQVLKNFPKIHVTRRFITVFTRAFHWSPYWARWIQSIPPHHIHLRSVLILSSHLRVVLSSGHFLSGFPTRTLCAILFYMRVRCPTRTGAGKANCWDEISKWHPWNHDRGYLMIRSADYHVFISVKTNREKKWKCVQFTPVSILTTYLTIHFNIIFLHNHRCIT